MARWKPEIFTQKLQRAADSFDHDKVEILCNDLVTHLRQRADPFPKDSAEKTLSILRRKRYFKLMQQVADAFIRAGLRHPKIHRQYAQALLDDSNISAGLSVLRSTLKEFRLPKKEMAEVQGLIGRAYKQIYMDADDMRPKKNREALRMAIRTYYGVYESNKNNLWHGINTVSLLKRAHRDKVIIRGTPGAEKIAEEIIAYINKKGDAETLNMWDIATGAEAYVALGRWKEARYWMKRYVGNKNADAFELASTLRQFEDVIQLDRADGDERYLIDFLQSQLIKREGGELRFSPESVNERASGAEDARERLEIVLGDKGYKPHQWLLTALKRAQIVGHIWRGGKGKASGFLLPDGSVIHPKWKNQQIFLTNKHVISNAPSDYRTLKPEQAEITFDALNRGGMNQPPYKATLLWESTPEVDTSILMLNEKVEGFEVYQSSLLLPELQRGKRIYVIGHPEGKELSYSLQNNRLIAYDDKYVHYRSPTTYGSSGSPLFNDDWLLIGIHHGKADKSLDKKATDKEYKANEGIPLSAIISEVKKTHKQ
jgi:hypothetical protein